MEITNKADRIKLFSFNSPQMRTFHMTWMAFFLCFFAWFGIAPLMVVVREELQLTKTQIGNIVIASVFFTIFARLLVGTLCDRFGPRITYSALLIFGSIPVMAISLAESYSTFLIARFLIGAIGASFVITQYHTSVMFSPKVVGTANATTAGWGNLGGGVTQMVMPLVFGGFVALGFRESIGWRLSMVIAGATTFVFGIAYFFLTQDTPNGNFKELKLGYWQDKNLREKDEAKRYEGFWKASKDFRVWILFLIYAACFGIELTINNIAAIYYHDKFGLDITTAGLIAGLFGLMNLFARSMGGIIGDRMAGRFGLDGRVKWLGIVLFIEGIALCIFSRMDILPIAIASMIVFSLFVQMAEGATYSVVPFVNKKALGAVSGIVGAGGNAGAVMAGYLFRMEGLTWSDALFYCGVVVSIVSFAAYAIKLKDVPSTSSLKVDDLESKDVAFT
ncbi:MAG: NarK family nitrate/nitrite MFS transporter [Pseudobacteriovorax sp.]|nr:NarK family nitrate/nitrite MFS transporter [Pseudobacteriovorax sp.]